MLAPVSLENYGATSSSARVRVDSPTQTPVAKEWFVEGRRYVRRCQRNGKVKHLSKTCNSERWNQVRKPIPYMVLEFLSSHSILAL